MQGSNKRKVILNKVIGFIIMQKEYEFSKKIFIFNALTINITDDGNQAILVFILVGVYQYQNCYRISALLFWHFQFMIILDTASFSQK